MKTLSIGIVPLSVPTMVLIDECAKVLNCWKLTNSEAGTLDLQKLIWIFKGIKIKYHPESIFGFMLTDNIRSIEFSRIKALAATMHIRMFPINRSFVEDKLGLSGTTNSLNDLGKELAASPIVTESNLTGAGDAFIVSVIRLWLMGVRKSLRSDVYNRLVRHD